MQSAAEAVQTSTSGNYGNLISGTAVKDLPIVGSRGRNPLDLVVTQPGVVSGAPTGGGIYVHGARDRAWNYTLDGIDVNDSSQGGSNTTSFRVNPDMLDEMRILTGNNTAENGRNSGGQVAMVTRSGTNDFHGDGFWFYRTPRLNANEWQNNLDNLGKAQLQQNIYGGGIGGPIVKNKTFFFVQIQALRARSSARHQPHRLHRHRAHGHPALRQGRPQSAGRHRRRVGGCRRQSPARPEHRHLQRRARRSAAHRPRPHRAAEIKNEPLPNNFATSATDSTPPATPSARRPPNGSTIRPSRSTRSSTPRTPSTAASPGAATIASATSSTAASPSSPADPAWSTPCAARATSPSTGASPPPAA